ncbi:MAG TPA: hypothetical protein VLT36_26175 [Candidatus Dormibacteraeota bacterium]|nr:hypothetical protein [Candidatus Dormibacteraeota bacterium]
MFHSFQRPSNGWLCAFSVLWFFVGVWFAGRFALGGHFIGAGLMGVYSLAALGLWFQSRAAALVLMTFACVGIIYALFKIGHVPWYRVASPITWAIWALFLLWEYLEEQPRE